MALKKVTDEEIAEALRLCQGQPTKAAEMLEVDYVTIWMRCKKNPELEEVKIAYRAKTFQAVTNLTAVAVIAGVMKEPVTDDEGVVIRDENNQIVYREVKVPTSLRLNHGNLLANMYKGDDGIKDQLELSSENDIDLSALDEKTLNKLAAIGVKTKRNE